MRKKSKYNHQIGKFLFPDWLTDSVLFKEPLLICLGGGLILGLRTKLHGAVSIVTVVVTDAEPFISFTDFVGRCWKSKKGDISVLIYNSLFLAY